MLHGGVGECWVKLDCSNTGFANTLQEGEHILKLNLSHVLYYVSSIRFLSEIIVSTISQEWLDSCRIFTDLS